MSYIYCFDIDETLCRTQGTNYLTSVPILDRIRKVNELFESGNIVKLHTARGSKTGVDWREVTENQLNDWGVLYHELAMGKPYADYYIDDKAINDMDFDWS